MLIDWLIWKERISWCFGLEAEESRSKAVLFWRVLACDDNTARDKQAQMEQKRKQLNMSFIQNPSSGQVTQRHERSSIPEGTAFLAQ